MFTNNEPFMSQAISLFVASFLYSRLRFVFARVVWHGRAL